MNKLPLLSPIIILLLCLSGCNKIEVFQKNKNTDDTVKVQPVTLSPSDNDSCGSTVSNFYAGQSTLAGTVTVENDSVNLYVTFNTIDGWQIQQTHLYVGALAGLPAGPKGNPKIGNFPYSASHNPRVASYTYTIPLTDFAPKECIIIAAHAEVVKFGEDGEVIQAETAWGAGKQITPGGSWASYFDYCICDDTKEVPGGSGNGGGGNSEG
jgi:hypothetical protein